MKNSLELSHDRTQIAINCRGVC